MTHPDPKVLERFRIPRCRHCAMFVGRTEPHHVWPSGRDNAFKLDIPMNLVPLCRPCHRICHMSPAGTHTTLVGYVAEREGLTVRHVERQMKRLRRAPPNPEAKVCPDCLGSCFVGFKVVACGKCDGGGILDRFGDPWVEPDRRFTWQA